jgi:hypothetical protein
VVVDDFDVERVARREPEADAPLVVDPDAELAFARAIERLQLVARRNAKVVDEPR